MSDYEDEQPAPRKVYWAGRQWCVTDFGLETVTPDRYYVEAERLGVLTDGRGPPMAETYRHICRKTWVDIEDLAAAFAVALQIHAGRYRPLPDGAYLEAISYGRRQRRHDGIYQVIKLARGLKEPTTGQMLDIGSEAEDVVAVEVEAGRSFNLIPDPAVATDDEMFDADADDE